ncbi:cadherin repeat domain-containing protein [bacterium]|nr:MAG: cadherin repeat domain-containing protein [bacterium]
MSVLRFTLLLLIIPILGFAQSPLVEKDLSYHMRIPGITQINTTEIHAYVLSEKEGLAVFRTHKDSLQWLFTIEDVEERGFHLQSDIRFAYLYGGSTQLHIIEPTSLLGIYSVADLGFEAHDVARIDAQLYICGKNGEFGFLDLSHPDSVVSSFKAWDNQLGIKKVKQIESYFETLFILGNDDSLSIIDKSKTGFELKKKLKIPYPIESVFLKNKTIYGTTYEGELIQIDALSGETKLLGKADGYITKLDFWNGFLITRTENGLVHLFDSGNFFNFNENPESGNHFGVSKGNLWFTEYADVFRLKWIQDSEREQVAKSVEQSEWKLKPVRDYILPYPKPLLVHVETEPRSVESNVVYTIFSPFENVTQVENNFTWQPGARDIGVHIFKVVATDQFGKNDSLSFTVDIRPFNLPPKFAPVRPMSLPVSEPFSITFSALDPDGMEKNLVRYVGVDMPSGAHLEEKTGVLTWTPNLEQVGKHDFRVIATDQYGTAASMDVSLTVIDVKRSGN